MIVIKNTFIDRSGERFMWINTTCEVPKNISFRVSNMIINPNMAGQIMWKEFVRIDKCPVSPADSYPDIS
ncbi:hypothetical protein A9F06_26170 [Klebsiella pneumoniae]|uniref:Uncharacterized protein n=1 Tax=Enterobacter hormaechei subsp. xiangfangensis TaxID=1296536 RepID=A0A837F7U5_9ENTR|nr:hypothetical protein SS59_26420 [Enterobacter hormaechei subsp. xiangfangensis]OKB55827.1 hypothetical protein A9F06_26170 [Klebsiella pneumoniae]